MASRISTNTISSHFFTLRKLSRDPTKWAPIFCWSSHGAQNAPKELPKTRTPKDHPESPDDPLGPRWNVKNVSRTYQVPSRALLTSPKGTPDAKKRHEEHQVCACPTPGTTTTTQYKHQVRKVCGCVAPSLINEQPMISYQMVAVPACSFRFLQVPCFPPTRVIHRFPWIRRSRAAS